MDRDNRNAAIAAAVILVLFFSFAYYLPVIMLAVGKVSGILGNEFSGIIIWVQRFKFQVMPLQNTSF